MKKFKFPNTRKCLVVWYRNNHRHETNIITPHNTEALKNEMIKHGVGMSEIRAVKSDPNSGLKDLLVIDLNALQNAMCRV